MNTGYTFINCNTDHKYIVFLFRFFGHMWRYLAHVKHLFSALKTQMHQIKVGDICATQYIKYIFEIIILYLFFSTIYLFMSENKRENHRYISSYIDKKVKYFLWRL